MVLPCSGGVETGERGLKPRSQEFEALVEELMAQPCQD